MKFEGLRGYWNCSRASLASNSSRVSQTVKVLHDPHSSILSVNQPPHRIRMWVEGFLTKSGCRILSYLTTLLKGGRICWSPSLSTTYMGSIQPDRQVDEVTRLHSIDVSIQVPYTDIITHDLLGISYPTTAWITSYDLSPQEPKKTREGDLKDLRRHMCQPILGTKCLKFHLVALSWL